MLKHFEFADVQSNAVEKFRQPLKEARYLVHDFYKGLPPEQWPNVPVPPEKRREIRRAMIVAERKFKTLRRAAFRNFRQTVTARSLRILTRKISQLTTITSLSQMLVQYESLDRQLTRVESYVSHAQSAVEFAVDVARGK